MTRPFLTNILLAAAFAIPAALLGCDRGSEVPPPAPPTPKASHPMNPATTRAATTTGMPGLSGMTGTPIGGMATSDAAAQRLIDSARAEMKTDLPKAKTLLGELKQQHMYDSLSPATKASVDQLQKDIDAASTTKP